MPILHFDFETRSVADLEAGGAYQYASHPSSDVWCCAYSVDDSEVKLWKQGDPVPEEVIEAARNPEWTFAAHNIAFERLIVRDIMAPRYGWPLLPDERLCCTMARALSLALPGKLENVAKALGLEHQKDAAGARLMREMSRPRAARDNEDPAGIYWVDDPEKIKRLYRYCIQDVETERALHRRIGFLPPAEQRVWEHNLLVNDRGLFIDGELLETGLRTADELEAEIKREIADVTAGKITSIHQTQRVLTWLEENGHKVENARKPTLQKELANGGVPPEAKRVMELRLDGASAAVKKLRRFQNWRGTDGRARGAMYYHGGATGRWSSKGIQLQNLKKPATDDLGAVISGKIENLSDAADLGRAVICADADRRFLLADFSGVESRIGAWVAGESSKAKQWKRFDDTGDPKTEPYYILGLKFGLPEDTARKIGKVADLAFLYCGSIGAWRNLSKDDGRSDKDILALRDLWRNAHPNIVRMWKMCERAALRAMHNPGATIPAGMLSFRYDGEFFLFMRLPSGRELAYPEPRLITDKFDREAIIFKDNANGKFVDCRHGQGAFGGTWFQNAVQAIARDILAETLLRLEAAGYPVVLHIHDEVVCEAPNGVGTLDEFAKLMTTLPAWAEGLPIAIGKPRNGQRFAKIKAPDAAEPIQARQSDTNTTPEPEIPQQNEQAPPWAPDKETPMQPPLNPEPGETPKHIEDAPPIVPAAPAEAAPAMPIQRQNGYPHGEEEPAGQKSAAEFLYRNAEQAPYLKVRKFEWFKDGKREKSFPQRWRVNGGWVSEKPAGWVPIPYRLPELLAAPTDAVVDIFEGEKDADRGAELGLIATTNPEGAKKWCPELNEYFHGRRVRVHEDNDDAGRAHAAKVAAALKDVAKEITVVRYPEVPPGEDFSWFMDHGGTLEAMVARARPFAGRPPFQWLDMSGWDREPVPQRKWAIRDRVPLRQAGLFSGEGGAGKSLIEMAKDVAHVTGQEWLGSHPEQGPAFYIGAEDDEDELHIRFSDIANYYGVTFDELVRGGLHVKCLLGQDATLCAANGKSGKVEVTNLYRDLYEQAGDIKPKNISIDTLTRAFAGSEIDRVAVYAFAMHMQALAMVANGAVTVLSHPSLQGMSSGSGISGSTAWHGAFRFRQYLTGVKPEPGDPPDQNVRELQFKKNQYGPMGETLVVRYRNGLFLLEEGATSIDQATRQATAEEIFVKLLQRFAGDKRRVSASPCQIYAPTLFAQEQEARGANLKANELADAMKRLFAAKKIWNQPHGPKSKERFNLAIKE
jgi:DNA polymerase